VYVPEQVLEILTVAALRRKGLSLQKIRKVLRLLRRELGQQGSVLMAKSKAYLVTDGNSVLVDGRPEDVLNRIAEARNPMYLIRCIVHGQLTTSVANTVHPLNSRRR
jgi:DNA-binding transcriptional MerR regulator